jgi:L,D-peptidoglycan transpeptidase YkuD (ErfK/YbiS/YcfS/YnhG family)
MITIDHKAARRIHMIVFRRVTVFQSPLDRTRGLAVAGAMRLPVALGRTGMRAVKREGDGATPTGSFALLRLWRRRDAKSPYGPCRLPERTIRKGDLWCDEPGHRLYNRPAHAPLAASHEEMRRSDMLYDAVIEIDCNIRPRIMGRGSAIFMHLAREGYSPTAGCIAFAPRDMRKLLPRIGHATRLVIRR